MLDETGPPEEVADLVVFLASRRASYISGTVVTIDFVVTGSSSGRITRVR